MPFLYPLDVDELVDRVRRRGGELEKYIGLREDMRPDLKLTTIAWRAGVGWFPVTQSREWHGALDIGLRDWGGDSVAGMQVKAIGPGTVVFVDDLVHSARGFAFGRVIVRHEAPGGVPFYFQYKHLDDVPAIDGMPVDGGDVLGVVGWHGDFPHLEISAASLVPIGGDADLVPQWSRAELPADERVWETLRVRVNAFDPVEWPIPELSGIPGYLFNPIELVRFCNDDPPLLDYGPGSFHEVEVVPRASSQPLANGSHVRVAAQPLRAAALREQSALAALAQRPAAAPITRGHGDAGAVAAIQRALKVAAYNLGGAGPKRDGVDGVFSDALEGVVKHFQEKKLKPMLEAAGGLLGKRAADCRTDGKIDWLTLVGLDLFAQAHERARPQPDPKATKASVPAKPAPPATAAAVPSYTIDASRGEDGLSLHFGLRMYKALLGWLWTGTWDKATKQGTYAGVGYSTTNAKHYGTQAQLDAGQAVLHKDLGNEWPDVQLAGARAKDAKGADKTVTVDGKSYPVYKCFGCEWVGTQFTNCCNSQMAALAVALGGGKFTVKGGEEYGVARAGSTTYDVANDSVLVSVATSAKGKEKKRGALVVFEQTFVTGTLFYKDGKPLYGRNETAGGTTTLKLDYGGMIYAIAALGIGEPLFTFDESKDQAKLKLMRIGDLAATQGHAILIGDVRYGVWVEGGSTLPTRPDYVLDQSSFIDSSAGTLVSATGKDPMTVTGRAEMTAADCDTLIGMEATFLSSVKAFLEATALTLPGGGSGKIRQTKVLGWRVFTANGLYDTAHARVYDGTGKKKLKDPPYTLSLSRTAAKFSENGITRPWSPAGPISLGRLYGPG